MEENTEPFIEEKEAQASEDITLWDNTKRAKTLQIVFAIIIVYTIISIISGLFEVQLLNRFLNGENIDLAAADANDTRQAVIGVVGLIIFIVSVVVFLNWFRRAYGNLIRLNTMRIDHNENMAVWAWFIPFINLYRPVQIMNEISHKTQRTVKNKRIIFSFFLKIWRDHKDSNLE
ncbi:MAG: DUF4328 domain-containing protein [Flavobacterium sp.]|nr:DUF4328 domain-containing protein [Flavobacterium sp.]